MDREKIIKHTDMAYRQWCEIWRKHATEHSKMKQKSFEDFRNSGIGKACLLVANGYSLEENIETIKKHQKNVDIFCCDKTLGHLLDHGITPKFCIVCDANVSWEKYGEKYKDQLKDTILFQNVCGNPDWTFKGNWKDVYMYVNKDVRHHEREFMSLSGCPNQVTAGTNVSNMMVVLLIQADNDKRQNLFSYDKLLLIGFDYGWRDDGKYYAFDETGDGKSFYMRHIYGMSNDGKIVFTSNNLSSSASWLRLYIDTFKIKVFQCGSGSLFAPGGYHDLEVQMQYRHKPSDSERVKKLLIRKRSIENELGSLDNEIRSIAKDHWLASQSI